MSNINQNNNPPQFNRGSSSIFNYAALNSSNETLDQPRVRLHQREDYHELQEQIEAEKRRESNPDPETMRPPLAVAPPPPTDSGEVAVVVRYRECQKNHAANMGAYVVDGCGEFMANGEEGSPESLKCAACECHRSFHRREVDGESQSTTWIPAIQNPPPRATAAAATMQTPYHHRYNHQMPPIMMAFGGNSVAPTESSSEDLDMYQTHGRQPVKKRFRTKITEDQKTKMHDFAEKIGWKIQKQDEQEILQFCDEVGLKRKVFKVWMHNSKQASKKKQE